MKDKIKKIIIENISSIRNDSSLIIDEPKFGLSIKYESSLLFRVINTIKTKFRIEFTSTNLEKDYFSNINSVVYKNDVIQIDIDRDEDLLIETIIKLIPAIEQQYKEIINNMRVATFACCSKYMECSNKNECLHQDDNYYRGCQYRKNLEAGRNFYGKQ